MVTDPRQRAEGGAKDVDPSKVEATATRGPRRATSGYQVVTPPQVAEATSVSGDDMDADEWLDWFHRQDKPNLVEKRDRLMLAGLRAGLTLQAVGVLFGLSRERVRQIAVGQGVSTTELRKQQREQRDRHRRRVARHIYAVSLSHPELTIGELAEWAETDEATVKKALEHRVAVHEVRYNTWSTEALSDEKLLAVLREWASDTTVHTGNDYTAWAKRRGMPSSQTLQLRFGGWNLALHRAGLQEYVKDRGGKRPVISDAEMWATVLEFFRSDQPSYSVQAFDSYALSEGFVSAASVRNRLGAWSAVKERVRELMRYAVGRDGSWEWAEDVLSVIPGEAPRNRVTRQDVLSAIRRVAPKVVGPLTVMAYEAARDPEDPHANLIQARFGSWVHAMVEADLTDRFSAKARHRWQAGSYDIL